MSVFSIKIGDEWVSHSSLLAVTKNKITNDFERKALTFCQSWLTDKQVFEFNTSGSTGTPKKISFKREQLIASAHLTAKALELTSGSTSLVCLDTEFIAGAMMLVRGMVVGMNMIIKPPSANPLENITEQIDFTALVPYQVIHLLEHPPEKLNSISKVIIGGAPLNQETIGLLQSLTPAFYATYGMTETITHIAIQKLNGSDRQDYFQLLPGIEVSIDDRSCLSIRASHLGNDPIITNDIVSLITKDKFQWIGRYDRVINSGGVKVSPEKIEKIVESAFAELKIKSRFFVESLQDQKLGQQVALVIEGEPLAGDILKNINDLLKGALEKYEMPRQVLFVSRFAETASQKIDRLATLKLLVTR